MSSLVTRRSAAMAMGRSLVFLSSACALRNVTAQTPAAERPDIKVGDYWRYDRTDRRTGAAERAIVRRVTAVTELSIEGSENEGRFVWTREANATENETAILSAPARTFNFPLQVGKAWDYKYAYANKTGTGKGRLQADARVTAFEKVTVPAGEFDAFRIEQSGYWNNEATGRNGRFRFTSWFAPVTRSLVKTVFDDGYNDWTQVLVEYRLAP